MRPLRVVALFMLFLVSSCFLATCSGDGPTQPETTVYGSQLKLMNGVWESVDTAYLCTYLTRHFERATRVDTFSPAGMPIDSTFFERIWLTFVRNQRLDGQELRQSSAVGSVLDTSVYFECRGYVYVAGYEDYPCKPRVTLYTAGTGDSLHWQFLSRIELEVAGTECELSPGDTVRWCNFVQQTFHKLME